MHPQALPRYRHKSSTQVVQDYPTIYHTQSHSPIWKHHLVTGMKGQLTSHSVPYYVTLLAHRLGPSQALVWAALSWAALAGPSSPGTTQSRL